ncbi:DUF3800 domain-containing protein [Achromobacter spanius]|nr:DUF3800 domain-containing protein [Achromobacter spanius]
MEELLGAVSVSTDEPLPEVSVADRLKAERREIKRAAERARLLESVAAGDFSTLTSKVGYMLNLYPDTRNSDVQLAIQYWGTFQPELFNEFGILPRNLFKLERMTLLTRARAKIQNEYGLFLANDTVRRGRRSNEERMQDAVIEDVKPRHTISIFADETGKNATWIIVAAVWVLDPRSVYDLTNKIKAWKDTSVWSSRKEIHFSKFGTIDAEPLGQYLSLIAENREFLGFKFAAVERAATQRSTEETVLRLHEFMAIQGLAHEVSSGRVGLPRSLELTVDKESSLDPLALYDAQMRIEARLRHTHGDQATVGWLQAAPSHRSALIQLADVIGGAINRILNSAGGPRNHKDEMADMVIRTLGIQFKTEAHERFDSAAMFYI